MCNLAWKDDFDYNTMNMILPIVVKVRANVLFACLAAVTTYCCRMCSVAVEAIVLFVGRYMSYQFVCPSAYVKHIHV